MRAFIHGDCTAGANGRCGRLRSGEAKSRGFWFPCPGANVERLLVRRKCDIRFRFDPVLRGVVLPFEKIGSHAASKICCGLHIMHVKYHKFIKYSIYSIAEVSVHVFIYFVGENYCTLFYN